MWSVEVDGKKVLDVHKLHNGTPARMQRTVVEMVKPAKPSGEMSGLYVA